MRSGASAHPPPVSRCPPTAASTRSPRASGWWDSTPTRPARRSSCACRAATTCSTPARRLPRSSSRASTSTVRARPCRRFPGCFAASSSRAARRRDRLRRLRPPSHRGRGDAGGARASSGRRRLIAVFQPHLYSRTKALARRLRRARSPRPTRSRVLDVYPAREEPVGELAGVSGLDVAARRRRPRRRAAGVVAAGRRARPSASSPRGCGEGDLLVTIGAGDIYRLARPARGEWRVGRPDERDPRRRSSATIRSRG